MTDAVRKKYLKVSPCQGIDLPTIERHEMRFLTTDEVAALASTIDERYRALVLLACYGGLRISELTGLKRNRVDILRGRIEVAEICVEVSGHLHWGPPKTKSGRRIITLPKPVVQELEHHLLNWPGDELVFSAPEGGPIRVASWRRRFWNPAVKKAGVRALRPHDMRHTAVALWLAAGGNPLEVSRRAGHSSVSFTLDRYGHIFEDADSKLADRLAGLYSEPDASSCDIFVTSGRAR